jgi:hypothetical protein
MERLPLSHDCQKRAFLTVKLFVYTDKLKNRSRELIRSLLVRQKNLTNAPRCAKKCEKMRKNAKKCERGNSLYILKNYPLLLYIIYIYCGTSVAKRS